MAEASAKPLYRSIPEPRAHSTPAAEGRKPDKFAILVASRRDTQVNRQFLCTLLIEINAECCKNTEKS